MSFHLAQVRGLSKKYWIFPLTLVKGQNGHLTILVKVKLWLFKSKQIKSQYFYFLPFFPSWIILTFRAWIHIHFFEIQFTFEYKVNQSLTFQSQKSTFWLFFNFDHFHHFLASKYESTFIFLIFKSYLNRKFDLKPIIDDYITCICQFLSLYLIRTIQIFHHIVLSFCHMS